MPTYSDLLRSIARDADSCTLTVTEDWMQGRSAFGGLQAALAVCAMRALVPADIPLRTLQFTFIAPVPGGAARATARVLRTGANAIHVEARLVDGDQTLAVGIGVFGKPRRSTIARSVQQPAVHDDGRPSMRFVPGVTPNFIQHFSARWLSGGEPFSGDQSPRAVIELDMHDEDRASEAHLIAIADFVPPVALSLLGAPTPGSSLTWMLEFLADRYDDLPLQGWRIDAEMVAARDGYTSQSTLIFGPSGDCVAISRQSMVVFG